MTQMCRVDEWHIALKIDLFEEKFVFEMVFMILLYDLFRDAGFLQSKICQIDLLVVTLALVLNLVHV